MFVELNQQIDGAPDIESALDIANRAAHAVYLGEEEYKVESRKRLDTAISLVLAFGQRWLTADPASLSAAYTRRQIEATQDGGNPWLQIIYMVTGHWDDAGKTVSWGGLKHQTKFHKRSYLNKYAGALRYLHDTGVKPDGVAEAIAAFDDNDFGKRLNGMVAKDRFDHKAPTRNMHVRDEDALKEAGDAVFAVIKFEDADSKAEAAAKPREFAMAWGVVVDGQFYPGGIVKKSDSRARTLAIASVKEAA